MHERLTDNCEIANKCRRAISAYIWMHSCSVL